jgi:hypothetical protein
MTKEDMPEFTVDQLERVAAVYRSLSGQRPWRTLDDADYQEILAKLGDGGFLAFYNLCEAKLREKNT